MRVAFVWWYYGGMKKPLCCALLVWAAACAFFVTVSAEETLHWAPGKMKVEDAFRTGYSYAEAALNLPDAIPEADTLHLLTGGGYPMMCRNGIVTLIIFTVKEGIVPPDGIIGFKTDPKWSPVDLYHALRTVGFECRQASSPDLQLPSDGDTASFELQTKWRLCAWKAEQPEIAFEFAFKANGLWSWKRTGMLEYALAIDPAVFKSAGKPLPPLPAPLPAREAGSTDAGATEIVRDTPEFLELRKKAALCLGAPLALQNTANYDMLALFKEGKSKVEPEIWKNLLASSWSIESREQFLETFDDVAANGHTASWVEMEKILDANPGLDPLRIALYMNYSVYQCDRLFLVRAARGWLGSRTIKAWDLGRLINVTRWAYAAGYITENEAWERILGMADELFALYASWEDYFAAYAAGRGFFGANDAWNYMEAVFTYVSKELARPDTVLSSEPNLWTGAGEPARTGSIQYAVSAEQQSAREYMGRIQELFEQAALVQETLDYESGLAATALLREMLAAAGIGDSRPPLYYGARLVEGGILYESGDSERAREATLEVLSYAPANETALELLDVCTPDSER
ncbi:MAG: DUF1266 domain-containing protein [Treponema sp.]|nr:MAG: DUF1266 domain-containing protein [Treponema sp.]